jgi:hypothetical protein
MPVDYAALARKHGGSRRPPKEAASAPSGGGRDYAALARKHGGTTVEAAEAKPEGSAVGRFMGNLWEGTGGQVPGLIKLGWELSHPDPGRRVAAAEAVLTAAKAGAVDQKDKAVASLQRAGETIARPVADYIATAEEVSPIEVVRRAGGGYLDAQADIAEAGGHGAAAVMPTIGPAAAAAGEQIAGGDVAGGLGSATALLAPSVAGKVVPKGATAVAAKISRGTSEWLARSAVKPLVSSMKRVAGASQTGVEAQAQRLIRNIISERIATPEQAAKILASTEKELEAVFRAKNAPTDAATRGQRYLERLRDRAAKAALSEDQVAAFEAKMGELVRGSMGEEVAVTVSRPSKLLDASGKPVMTQVDESVRRLRREVPADEALNSARASEKTKRAWGEQKSAEMEAHKAVERAQRDAVKAAVPEAKPLLQREARVIRAKEALDRMAFREGNREPLGLSTVIVAGQEVAQGRIPVMAMAAEVLRGNKLRGSFLLDDLRLALEKSVKTGNAPQTAHILTRLGVRVAPRDLKPSRPSALPRAADQDEEEDQPRSRVATR